ncbi:hypothetical protein ACQY0O_000743 [Thecaphora frezii]
MRPSSQLSSAGRAAATAATMPAVMLRPSLLRRAAPPRRLSAGSTLFPSASLAATVRVAPPSIRSSRGFASSSPRPQASEASTSATSTASAALADPASSSASSSAELASSTFLDPLVPALHSLAETLHITGPSSHALSIVVLAFAVRTVFTLPMTIWQRRRTLRMTELVVPEWTAYKEKAPNVVRARCRKAGKSYEEFQKELQADLKAKINSLMKQHRCAPLPSLLAPFAVHLPVFLVVSALIRQAALASGTPFADEVLPWWSPSPEMAAQFKASASILADRGLEPELIAKLHGTQGGPTLADRDTSMIGPVSLGLLTMTNVELTSWSRRALAKLASVGTPAASDKPKEAVDVVDAEEEEPRRTRILTNVFRTLAIAAIPIATQAPGALIIYWLSSGVYTLMQNSVFAFLDRRREAQKLLLRSAARPAPRQ